MSEESRPGPVYTGMTKYTDEKGGYAVWIPEDWFKFALRRRHYGMLFSPYKDDINTSVLVEKRKLDTIVTRDDLDVLKESFHQGIINLPGIEIDSEIVNISETVIILDASFAFLDEGNRRKRWVRNVYWTAGQLVLIAQGRTVKDFEYWTQVFYNIMSTVQLL